MTLQPVLLGDPHLGRRFNKGIPVERRGQREQLVREDFVARLDPKGATTHICMGDLFDKPQVPYEDLLFAFHSYRRAAAIHPFTTFYIIQGNHDDSRDLDEITAWDLFCTMVEGIPNITTVTEPLIGPDFALFPWHPTETAVEMIARCRETIQLMGAPPAAYGHWDTDPRGASHNLIPTRELAALGITKAYTGHVHLPSTFNRDGVEVVVVGSMQPYAQGEDGGQAGGVHYLTLTLDALRDGGDFSDCCIRLQLQPGEQAPDQIPECRSFDVQRLRPVEAEVPADISMEGFDATAAARAALDEHDIIPEVRDQIDRKWTEVFDHAG